jgi:DNA-binding MarR family transcriptional regulator
VNKKLVLFDINNDICFNFQKISRKLTRYYDNNLRSKSIRCGQLFLLIAFSDKELSKKRLSDVADHLSMDRTTLSVNLRTLRRRGFVEDAAVKDMRVRTYVLTDSGKSILNDCAKIIFGLSGKLGQAGKVLDPPGEYVVMKDFFEGLLSNEILNTKNQR